MVLADYSDEQLVQMLEAEGGVSALARRMDVAQSTLSDNLFRRGINKPPAGASDRPDKPTHGGSRRRLPSFSLEDIHQGMEPPNNCRVKTFLDALDSESREALETALSYSKRDLPAPRLVEILHQKGFKDADVPGTDAINAHRSGVRPCRCRG